MRLAVLTSGRQDWGILRSTCLALRDHPRFDLSLWAGGMHLSPRFGRTLTMLEDEGFEPEALLPWLEGGDTLDELTVADEAAEALRLCGQALARTRPDALFLVGDRYETMAAGMAATVARTPVIHLHGGEETAGAFDNSLRHALTKLAHLHLVSHPEHAARVVALGEDPATVHVVGAPGLDNGRRPDLPDRAALEAELGIPLSSPVVVVALHPATLGDDPAREAAAVVAAMNAVPATYVITLPNSDPGNQTTRDVLNAAAAGPGRLAVDALGEKRFWGLLRACDAMLGNSSSAIIEAPLFQVPAVNVGQRQRGRLRGANVLDAEPTPAAVTDALRRALDPSFRASLAGTSSPFGRGDAAARIVSVLEAWTPPSPPTKAPITARAPTGRPQGTPS